MFKQTFKNIHDILHHHAGRAAELEYVEQTSWISFLKYLYGAFNGEPKTTELVEA